MAAKKRRKSRKLGGLAGSPEHHRVEADEGYARGRKAFALMQRTLKIGTCDNAFESLLEGLHHVDRSDVHARESGLTHRPSDLTDEMLSATDSFQKHCVLRKA